MITRIKTFFALERQEVGWRFWLYWVILTNVGWFPGIAIGLWLSNFGPPLSDALLDDLVRSVVSGIPVGLLVGITQALVLQRHLRDMKWWALTFAIGWPIGVLIGRYTVLIIDPSASPFGALNIILVAAAGGAVVGIPQWPILQKRIQRAGAWWILVSAVGWAIQFPGMFPGFFMMRLLAPNGAEAAGDLEHEG